MQMPAPIIIAWCPFFWRNYKAGGGGCANSAGVLLVGGGRRFAQRRGGVVGRRHMPPGPLDSGTASGPSNRQTGRWKRQGGAGGGVAGPIWRKGVIFVFEKCIITDYDFFKWLLVLLPNTAASFRNATNYYWITASLQKITAEVLHITTTSLHVTTVLLQKYYVLLRFTTVLCLHYCSITLYKLRISFFLYRIYYLLLHKYYIVTTNYYSIITPLLHITIDYNGGLDPLLLHIYY